MTRLFALVFLQLVRAGNISLDCCSNLMTVDDVYEVSKQETQKSLLLDTANLVQDPVSLYSNEHIENAVHFSINKVTKNSSVIRHKLPSVDEFQEYSRKIGVTRDSLVVIYDHSEESHNRSIMSATYTWWLFKTFGHHKVAVMNGGISKWKASGHLLTSNQTKIVPGNINASWNPSYLVQFDEVLDYVKMNLNLKSKLFQLIDARPIDQFLGKVNLGNAKFAGHIIDAVNFPIDLVLNTDGSIKELSTIEALLKIAGLQLDQFTIVYCNTGLQASTVVFVLTQLGVPVKLFEGNWVEWSFKAPLELSVLPKKEQK